MKIGVLSRITNFVYDGKFADVDIPNDIINCLVEEWEKSMGLKVGI